MAAGIPILKQHTKLFGVDWPVCTASRYSYPHKTGVYTKRQAQDLSKATHGHWHTQTVIGNDANEREKKTKLFITGGWKKKNREKTLEHFKKCRKGTPNRRGKETFSGRQPGG